MNENKTIPTTPVIGQIYTAVILAVDAQEQEQTENKKGWARYRIVIDIADGASKGYYAHNFEDFQRRQYQGVLDWYLPSADYDETKYKSIEWRLEQQAAADTVKSTDTTYNALGIVPVTAAEKSYYYEQKRSIDNIAAILKYNSLVSLPENWAGLLIPIRLAMRDGVLPTIDGWLPFVSAPAPATADTDLAHYARSEDIDAVINKAPCLKLTDILHTRKVKGKDIMIAPRDYLDDFLTRKAAAKKATLKIPPHTSQMPSISPLTSATHHPSSLAPEGCEANIEALAEAILKRQTDASLKRQRGEVQEVDINKIAADFNAAVKIDVHDEHDELEREKEQTRRQKAINQAKAKAEQEFLEMFSPPKY